MGPMIDKLYKAITNKDSYICDQFYNPYLEQHVELGDGAGKFYDLDYKLIFKEPLFRTADFIQFIDKDLCFVNFVSSNKKLLYNITKRELVDKFILRLPKKIGYMNDCTKALYIKSTHTILAEIWYHTAESESESYEAKFGHRAIFAYDIAKKEYKKLYGPLTFDVWDIYLEHNNKYCFRVTKYNGPVEKSTPELVVFEEDLTYKVFELAKPPYKVITDRADTKPYLRKDVDIEKGLLIYYPDGDEFDGYYYFGDGTELYAIYLDGNIVDWQPQRRYIQAENTKKTKKTAVDSETYVRKHGVDKFAIENFEPEELVHGGFFWALDRLTKKSKVENKKIKQLITEGQATDEELVLYSIGWLSAEIGNGGLEQYFYNGNISEFTALKQALTLVGAPNCVKAVAKGEKLIANYEKLENPSELAHEKLSDKLADLETDFTEDYETLAVEFIKKINGMNSIL